VEDPSSDAELLRVSLSDPDAFVVIFDRHFDSICGYLARRAGVDEGSELASEVFVRAFERRSRYDFARADAAPWLYGIAANVLRRRRRSELRRIRAYLRVRPEPPPTDVARESDPELAAALASLKAVDREALLLFAWAELGYEEIAEALAVPVGTVRSRLNRARRQLRVVLGEDPVAARKEPVNG
jgi:RNA polymerase sigma factor (sigma-70 family)